MTLSKREREREGRREKRLSDLEKGRDLLYERRERRTLSKSCRDVQYEKGEREGP